MKVRVLACQLDIPAATSVELQRAHLEATADKLSRCLDRQPADLVVLPELSSVEYSRNAFERLDEISEPAEGRSFEVFAALARRHQVHVAFGIARTDTPRRYISQVVAGPDGLCRGYYDKLHMAQFGASMEKEYFSRGNHLLVFDVNGVNVAPIICYDFRFPNLAATLCRDHEVKLIIHPVAFYRDNSFPSWHSIAIARAVENQLYCLSLNRAGATFGESIWCPPWVDDAHRPERYDRREALRYFTLDTDVIDAARKDYPFESDRLPDYRRLSARGKTD